MVLGSKQVTFFSKKKKKSLKVIHYTGRATQSHPGSRRAM